MWSAQFELMLHEFKLGCVLIQLDECILEEATFLLRQKNVGIGLRLDKLSN